MLLLFFACTLGLKTDEILLNPLSDTADIDSDTANPFDSGIEDSGSLDTADTEDTEDTEEPEDTSDPFNEDNDGDGFTPNEGDCDDSNPDIKPFVFDDCDNIDNDCDGSIDEDGPQDIYEPNDTENYDLGYYTAGGYVNIEGVILDPTDIDNFEFYLEDGWTDDFSIEVELHAISLQTDFVVELWLIESAEGDTNQQLLSLNNVGPGLGEIGNYQGEGVSWDYPLGYDDSGYYQVIVTALTGQDCTAAYELEIRMSY